MLGPRVRLVFSKRAVFRARVGADDAGGYAGVAGGGWTGGAVGGGSHPEHPLEAGGEGADALQADRERDLRHRVVGVAEQRGRPLQPPGEEVDVRRLPEGTAKLAAEVGLGETRG